MAGTRFLPLLFLIASSVISGSTVQRSEREVNYDNFISNSSEEETYATHIPKNSDTEAPYTYATHIPKNLDVDAPYQYSTYIPKPSDTEAPYEYATFIPKSSNPSTYATFIPKLSTPSTYPTYIPKLSTPSTYPTYIPKSSTPSTYATFIPPPTTLPPSVPPGHGTSLEEYKRYERRTVALPKNGNRTYANSLKRNYADKTDFDQKENIIANRIDDYADEYYISDNLKPNYLNKNRSLFLKKPMSIAKKNKHSKKLSKENITSVNRRVSAETLPWSKIVKNSWKKIDSRLGLGRNKSTPDKLNSLIYNKSSDAKSKRITVVGMRNDENLNIPVNNALVFSPSPTWLKRIKRRYPGARTKVIVRQTGATIPTSDKSTVFMDMLAFRQNKINSTDLANFIRKQRDIISANNGYNSLHKQISTADFTPVVSSSSSFGPPKRDDIVIIVLPEELIDLRISAVNSNGTAPVPIENLSQSLLTGNMQPPSQFVQANQQIRNSVPPLPLALEPVAAIGANIDQFQSGAASIQPRNPSTLTNFQQSASNSQINPSQVLSNNPTRTFSNAAFFIQPTAANLVQASTSEPSSFFATIFQTDDPIAETTTVDSRLAGFDAPKDGTLLIQNALSNDQNLAALHLINDNSIIRRPSSNLAKNLRNNARLPQQVLLFPVTSNINKVRATTEKATTTKTPPTTRAPSGFRLPNIDFLAPIRALTNRFSRSTTNDNTAPNLSRIRQNMNDFSLFEWMASQ